MNKQFHDRVVVITGANSELGREYSHYFARHGANLILQDQRGVELSDFVESNNLQDEVLKQSSIDLSDSEAVESFVSETVRQFDKVDVLINGGVKCDAGSLLSNNYSDVAELLNQHLLGTLYMSKAALPYMLSRGYGRIINTSSGAGAFGAKDNAVYAASCAGVAGFGRSFNLELLSTSVVVNTIAPFVATDLKQCMGESISLSDSAMYRSEFIVPAVAYLAHERCAIGGCLLSLTGGRIAQIFTSTVPGFYIDGDGIEHVAENLEAILDTSYAMVPQDCSDELLMIDI